MISPHIGLRQLSIGDLDLVEVSKLAMFRQNNISYIKSSIIRWFLQRHMSIEIVYKPIIQLNSEYAI